jgi:hypothetical protein
MTSSRAIPSYQAMVCRVCGSRIEPDLDVVERLRARRAAASRDDCIYGCACGASYSNASRSNARVLIAPSPEQNVPTPVRAGLASALAQAVNETNRANKRAKFCFETSEDAVTWTSFNALEKAGRLSAAIPDAPEARPRMLLWGAPLVGRDAARIASELRSVCIGLGEDERRLSEPDVILVWAELLVFIEAKYRSPNDRQPHYRNFDLYVDDRRDLFAVPPDKVAAAGFYELTRNWRIGIELAQRLNLREFRLVNLGGPALTVSASQFAATIRQTDARRFWHTRWAELLEKSAPLESWLAEYVKARGLGQL